MDNLPAFLWVAAPLTGLIVQPLIGHFQDRTWNRFGRRRPYFLTGAVFAALALIGDAAQLRNLCTLLFAARCCGCSTPASNVSMEPFRAFVGDMLPTRTA